MDIGTILQQIFHRANPIEPSSKVEGCGIPSFDVTAVDIIWCTEALERVT